MFFTNSWICAKCIICRDDVFHKAILCTQCLKDIKFIVMPCNKCGAPIEEHLNEYKIDVCNPCFLKTNNTNDNILFNSIEYIDKIRALCVYNEGLNKNSIKSLIFYLKSNYNNSYYFNTVSKMLLNHYHKFILEYDIICCVPMYWTRFIIRSFNQSEILSNFIHMNAEKLYDHKMILQNNLIKKSRFTGLQKAATTTKERIANVKNSFTVNIKSNSLFCSHPKELYIKGKNILLVDDVITTGATANECAKVLKKAGAASVGLIVIGRTLIS